MRTSVNLASPRLLQASEEVWAGHIPTPGEYNITAELTRGWMLMDITMAAVDPLVRTRSVTDFVHTLMEAKQQAGSNASLRSIRH